jgi:hypothetical protein
LTPLPPGIPLQCPRRVGFLFPHACHRQTPLDCPDCQNGQVDDPYITHDRYYYSHYDSYDDGYYGPEYVMGTTYAGDSGDATAMDFTEADGADLVKPDSDFENDMNAS